MEKRRDKIDKPGEVQKWSKTLRKGVSGLGKMLKKGAEKGGELVRKGAEGLGKRFAQGTKRKGQETMTHREQEISKRADIKRKRKADAGGKPKETKVVRGKFTPDKEDSSKSKGATPGQKQLPGQKQIAASYSPLLDNSEYEMMNEHLTVNQSEGKDRWQTLMESVINEKKKG